MDGDEEKEVQHIDVTKLEEELEETEQISQPDTMNEMRIVLLGKTGAGKSELGNAIFEENIFKTGHTAQSETKKCQTKNKIVNGRRITMIDTPGFFDTNQPEEMLRSEKTGHTAKSETSKCQKQTKYVDERKITFIDTPGFLYTDEKKNPEEDMKSEIVKCIIECAPGPHAFLIVLKVEKFTKHEKGVVDIIQEYFSEEALKYAVIVFTHGDQLDEGQKIEEFLKGNKDLSDLLSKCGGRCHVVDNRYWKNNQEDEYRNNKSQVEKLLTTIEAMVDKGDYYTNEMLQEVERKIQEEEKRIRELHKNMSDEEIRKEAKHNVYSFLKKIAGVTIGALLGLFLGAAKKGARIGADIAEQAGSIIETIRKTYVFMCDSKGTFQKNPSCQKGSGEE